MPIDTERVETFDAHEQRTVATHKRAVGKLDALPDYEL
jgi:hypothetical protein